ncbi:MAG: hypothetical protein WC632_00410 [Candidatus Margulisiibacteriota bacterium]
MKKYLLTVWLVAGLAGAAFCWTVSLNAYVFSGPANNPLDTSTYPLVNSKVIFSVAHLTPDDKVVEEWAGSDLTDSNGIASYNKEIKHKDVTKVIYSVMVKSGEQIASSKDYVIIKPSGGNFAAGFILVSMGPNGGLPATTTTTTTLPPSGRGSLETTALGSSAEVTPLGTASGTPDGGTSTTSGSTTTTVQP